MFIFKTKNSPIYSEKEFSRAVQREKERSNRYGSSFSCLIFESQGSGIPMRRTKKLVNAISNRVRWVDEMGWVNDKDIGVLLSGTDAAQAQKVAQDIVHRLPRRQTPIAFSVQSQTA